MRYDYLLALHKIYSEFNNRNDVFDIIVDELGDLDSAIASFNLETKEIVLNKDETDECYKILPIKDKDKLIGISLKREKKEFNGEQFSLTKNIIPESNKKNSIIISSLEKVITKDYTIFYASSKSIIDEKVPTINVEKLGIWLYDNEAINDNEELFQVTNIDFYKSFNEIENNIKEQVCILPDFVSKLEIDYSRTFEDFVKDVIFIDNNYKLNKTKINCTIAPTYMYSPGNKPNFDYYKRLLRLIGEEVPVLPIETSFTPIDKTIGSYLIEKKKRLILKKEDV